MEDSDPSRWDDRNVDPVIQEEEMLMKATQRKKLDLAQKPTPIELLPRLSRLLGGPDIYIKRDDLTGGGVSGNKIRKLEYCVAEALDKGAHVLITCGGIQSNHARATAAVAARLGLSSHLVLNGTPDEIPEGNLFLDLLFNARITFLSEEKGSERDSTMECLAREYEKQGKRAYIIPLGASNPLGCLGYVDAVTEMIPQVAALPSQPRHLVTAVGSGGTLAGLVAGVLLHKLPWRITAISVAYPRQQVLETVQHLLEALRKTDFPDLGILPRETLTVLDDYLGEGYGKTTPEQLRFIATAAATEEQLLDPVYTGKAFYGLAREIEAGRFPKEEPVLFLHTGGVFGLFPFRKQFNQAVFSTLSAPGKN